MKSREQVDIIIDLHRLENETDFEWKLRCCLAKKRKETDMDWIEIRDMLGLNITPDQLRKQAVGYEEYDNYIHNCEGASERILCVSDVHIPFNLPIDIFASYKGIVDTLIVNGDLLDCFSCSAFPKKFKVNLDEELVLGRQYIINLINLTTPCYTNKSTVIIIIKVCLNIRLVLNKPINQKCMTKFRQ